jgi:hypothetical protein
MLLCILWVFYRWSLYSIYVDIVMPIVIVIIVIVIIISSIIIIDFLLIDKSIPTLSQTIIMALIITIRHLIIKLFNNLTN